MIQTSESKNEKLQQLKQYKKLKDQFKNRAFRTAHFMNFFRQIWKL